MLREHVTHSDRSAAEQAEFLAHGNEVTRRMLNLVAVVAVAVAILTWPFDQVAP